MANANVSMREILKLEEQMGILVLMLKLLLYMVLRLKIASWHDGTTSSRHNR